MTIQSPEEAKLINLRDCFREIGDLKFAALLLEDADQQVSIVGKARK